MMECSEFIAITKSHTSDDDSMFCVRNNSLSFASLESFTSFVVQSLLVEDWTLDTSSDFNPNMWFSSLTDSHFLMNFLSTKEFTVLIVFPHVPYGFLS